MTEEKTAVGYTRLSQQSDVSIERQKEIIHEYAEEKDLNIDRIYNEGERSSGFDASREQYQEMLSDAEDGEFSVLVVRDGSRIGRDFMERLDVFGDLNNKWGVEFHTSKHGYVDPDEPMTVLQEVFRAATDDTSKREEIRKAREEVERRLENGYWQGRPPYGFKFDADGEYLEPDPKTFSEAVDVIRIRSTRGVSYREIADRTDVPKSTVARILDRVDFYEQHIEDRVGFDAVDD